MWNAKIYSRAKPDTKEEEYLNKYSKKNRTRISYWKLEVGGREKNNKDWLMDNYRWEGGELKALYIHERGAKALGSDRPELDQFTPPQ